MRFGIMAMQLEALVPSNLPQDQVIAHLFNFDHSRLVQGLAENGFKLIELGGDLSMFLPQSYTPEAIDRLIEVRDLLGLRYTVHLPLWSVEPSTPLEPVRKGSITAVCDIIQKTCSLEPEIYVLHATGALAAEFYRMRISETARQIILRQFQSGARESLKRILDNTGIPPRKLAIETIEFPLGLTLELAEEIDLAICLDTGHVLVGFSGPVDLFEVLETVLPRLGEIHLHDGPWQGTEMKIGYGLDHQALGKGDLDLKRFLIRLSQADYRGPIIFELSVEEALDSLTVIRKTIPTLDIE